MLEAGEFNQHFILTCLSFLMGTTIWLEKFSSADMWPCDSFFFFNWRLITLQYCGGFCHTLTWISHGCTCVPHPEPLSHLPPHLIPLGLSQYIGFERPASCIEFALVVCFTHGNVHESVLFSQEPVILNQPLKQFPNFHLVLRMFTF